MSNAPIDVAVIIGSTREGRRGGAVGRWAAAHAGQRPDLRVDVLDLAAIPLPAVHPAHPDDTTTAYRSRLATADAFVVVTPEYNHSMPGALKHAIDLAHEEWRHKPVGFVSYGGLSGGLRAVEHLRATFAELHAVTVRDTVSFHGPWNGFGPEGPADPGSAAEALGVMLEDLLWWARALRTARGEELERAW